MQVSYYDVYNSIIKFASFMHFIGMDGFLRPGHEVF